MLKEPIDKIWISETIQKIIKSPLTSHRFRKNQIYDTPKNKFNATWMITMALILKDLRTATDGIFTINMRNVSSNENVMNKANEY